MFRDRLLAIVIITATFLVASVPAAEPAPVKPLPAEVFNGTDRLVFVWKDGQLDLAKQVVSDAGFTLVRISEHRGTCTWNGKLTQEQLDKLQFHPSIKTVYPDPKFAGDN